ncbi:MAG: efflux RND transporter periplasmic adaptor subunit [Casimicrobiaceae bacterium]
MSRMYPRVLLSIGALTLAACGQHPQQGFHGFPPAHVTVQKVVAKSLPVAFEYTGQTIGSKDVEVRARVNGIVEKRTFDEGKPVKAGQLLFVIDAKPYEAIVEVARADLARAQAQKAQADREAARLKPLAERHAIGQKEADDAQSNAELADASIKSSQAKLDSALLDLGYTRVVSPISGLSSRAQVSEGALATAYQTLLTVVSQVDPIWIRFNIAENDQLRINNAVAQGKLSLPANNAYDVTIRLSDGSLFPRKGHINFSDTRVNPGTGTYELRAEIPNKDLALKPGQFVRVTLAGAMRKDAITVPQVAVLDGTQGKFVYVAGKDKDGKDVALPRPVVLGDWVDATGGNLYTLESGLQPGDAVIIDGVAKLAPGAPIIPDGAGAQPPAGAAPGGAQPAAPAKGTEPKKS